MTLAKNALRVFVIGMLAISSTTAAGCNKVDAQNVTPFDPSQLPPNVKVLQGPERQAIFETAKREDLPKPADTLVIEGRRVWKQSFLTADKIIFAPDAELIFSCDATMKRDTMLIVANEIASRDQERPGRISWDCPGRTVPNELGTAQSGADMATGEEGATGGAGSTGQQGISGEAGRQAPNITIVAMRIINPLLVDIAGQNGGQGGKGQTGGSGGGGGRGNPASQGMFGCNRGAGNGARGGSGGVGGKGGNGGNGGGGGELTLIVPDDVVPMATRLLQTKLSGGSGGQSGVGGDPGAGGPGGPGGQDARPYCSGSGSQGSPGGVGAAGGNGELGARGNDGVFYVGSLRPDEFNRLTRTTTN